MEMKYIKERKIASYVWLLSWEMKMKTRLSPTHINRVKSWKLFGQMNNKSRIDLFGQSDRKSKFGIRKIKLTSLDNIFLPNKVMSPFGQWF